MAAAKLGARGRELTDDRCIGMKGTQRNESAVGRSEA